MKRIVIAAALAMLGACSQAKTEPAPEATEEVAAAPAGVMAADGKSPVGKFTITTADGEVFNEELKADGTYVQTQDGKVVETGKWVQKAPETFCYTKDEDGATEVCNTEKVENGVWSTVGPEGKTATVARVEV